MKIISWEGVEPREVSLGVKVRTLVYSDELMVTYVEIEPGATMPIHHHPHQQAGYVIQGTFKFVGDHERVMRAGESYLLAPNQRHGVEALGDETAILLDIFHPARDRYKR
ncbi:MAG: cupin domain-containing protein [Candidatus Bipolaricaulia bacterium]